MKDIELKMRLQSHSENMKNSIEAPFNITEKIDEMEMCDMTKKTVSFNWLKKTMYSAAAIAASFVLMVNCIPSLAYAASDVPILGDIVRVVTFGRFEVTEENYEAKITTPKIEGLLNTQPITCMMLVVSTYLEPIIQPPRLKMKITDAF